MYLQSIKSVKHNAAKSVNRSILKKSRHIGFGVFIVHSSMVCTEAPGLSNLQQGTGHTPSQQPNMNRSSETQTRDSIRTILEISLIRARSVRNFRLSQLRVGVHAHTNLINSIIYSIYPLHLSYCTSLRPPPKQLTREHRLNTEFDLQSLFGLHVLYTAEAESKEKHGV
jgi:hypothetical protein